MLLGFGCAGRAVDLRPESIPPTHGAVLGRIQIFKGDSEVTSACYVNLTDENEVAVGRLSLDRTGWVATSLKQGETYLSYVSCAVWNGLSYATRSLHFTVRGHGTVTYFGHLRFDLEDRDAEITLAAAAGGLSAPVGNMGAAVGAGFAARAEVDRTPRDERVTVTDEADEASRAFTEKYRIIPSLFKSLAAKPDEPSDVTPAVVTRGDAVSTTVRTEGMRVSLIGLVRPDARWLGVRLTQEAMKAELSKCKEIALAVDAATHQLPATYRAKPVGGFLREELSAELDVETLRSITTGGKVTFEACGKNATFPKRAVPPATEVLSSFESRVKALPEGELADAGAPATPSRGDSAAVDAGSETSADAGVAR
jgi:hypothetical protein